VAGLRGYIETCLACAKHPHPLPPRTVRPKTLVETLPFTVVPKTQIADVMAVSGVRFAKLPFPVYRVCLAIMLEMMCTTCTAYTSSCRSLSYAYRRPVRVTSAPTACWGCRHQSVTRAEAPGTPSAKDPADPRSDCRCEPSCFNVVSPEWNLRPLLGCLSLVLPIGLRHAIGPKPNRC
jgi:hypothetical protein